MSRNYHLSVSVRGLLRQSNQQLDGVLKDDAGKSMSGQAAREELMNELAKGREVIPIGPACEGFDYKTGCQGHGSPDEHDATAADIARLG